MNAANKILEHSKEAGEHRVLVAPSGVRSVRDVVDAATRLASALVAHGVRPGDRVLIQLPNGPEVSQSILATLMCGGVVVLAYEDMPVRELERIAAHCAPAAVIVRASAPGIALTDIPVRILVGESDADAGWSSMSALIADSPPMHSTVARDGQDLAVLHYTSGTTGSPKAVMYCHGGLGAMLDRAIESAAANPPGTVVLQLLPSNSMGGWLAIEPLIGDKRTVAVELPAQPEAIARAIEDHRVTHVGMVPTIAEALLGSEQLKGRDCSTLRLVAVGGAMVRKDLVDRLEAALGVRPIIIYGMTEVPGRVAWKHPDSPAESVGRVSPGVEVQIVDPSGRALAPGEIGEIWMRSPTAAVGYYRQPEATAAVFHDGWVRTGDQGWINEDRDLFVTGRIKEIIIQGGVNIDPHEIAGLVERLEGVAECAVVGIPNPLFGEEAVACVVSPERVPAERILAHCRRALDPRKAPARVLFFESIPRTVTGKVRTAALRDLVLARDQEIHGSDLAEELRSLAPQAQHARVRGVLVRELGRVLLDEGHASSPTAMAGTFADMGLSSLGGLLLSRQLGAALGQTLPPTLFFRFTTVDALTSHLVARAMGEGAESFALEGELPLRPTGLERFGLSDPQAVFWHLQRQDPDGGKSLRVLLRLEIEGPLDGDLLIDCVRALHRRHDLLRTRYSGTGEDAVQEVLRPEDAPPIAVELVDLSSLPAEQRDASWREHLGRLQDKPLDLGAGENLHVCLFRLAPGEHRLTLALHHIAYDLYTFGALANELAELYRHRGQQPAPERERLQYIDYVAALQEFAATQEGRAQCRYWHDKFAGQTPMEVPVDVSRSELEDRNPRGPFGVRSSLLSSRFTSLPDSAVAAMWALSRKTRASKPAVFLTVFAQLLRELSGQEDIYIENIHNLRPVFGDAASMIGAVVTAPTLRLHTTETVDDAAFERCERELAESRKNLAVPLLPLTPWPFRRVRFNYVLASGKSESESTVDFGSGTRGRVLPTGWVGNERRSCELALLVVEHQEGFGIGWFHDRDLFREDTVLRIADQYVRLLAQVAGGLS